MSWYVMLLLCYNKKKGDEIMKYLKKPRSVNELKRRIHDYFESRLSAVVDKNGIPMTDIDGEVVKKVAIPYTVTGLALALGCESREELSSFENPEMQRYIKMSIMKIEEYAEERLFNKEAFSGVKLFLSVNFERWRNAEATDDGDFELPESIQRWTV